MSYDRKKVENHWLRQLLNRIFDHRVERVIYKKQAKKCVWQLLVISSDRGLDVGCGFEPR